MRQCVYFLGCLKFGCQYRYSPLLGKTGLQNDLLVLYRGVRLYSITPFLSLSQHRGYPPHSHKAELVGGLVSGRWLCKESGRQTEGSLESPVGNDSKHDRNITLCYVLFVVILPNSLCSRTWCPHGELVNFTIYSYSGYDLQTFFIRLVYVSETLRRYRIITVLLNCICHIAVAVLSSHCICLHCVPKNAPLSCDDNFVKS